MPTSDPTSCRPSIDGCNRTNEIIECTVLARLQSCPCPRLSVTALQAINRTSEIIECTQARVDLDRILGLQVSALLLVFWAAQDTHGHFGALAACSVLSGWYVQLPSLAPALATCSPSTPDALERWCVADSHTASVYPMQSFDLEKILSMDPAFLTVSRWSAVGWSVHGPSNLGCQMCWLT